MNPTVHVSLDYFDLDDDVDECGLYHLITILDRQLFVVFYSNREHFFDLFLPSIFLYHTIFFNLDRELGQVSQIQHRVPISLYQRVEAQTLLIPPYLVQTHSVLVVSMSPDCVKAALYSFLIIFLIDGLPRFYSLARLLRRK